MPTLPPTATGDAEAPSPGSAVPEGGLPNSTDVRDLPVSPRKTNYAIYWIIGIAVPLAVLGLGTGLFRARVRFKAEE
jgi:hypothetical protein